jgi:hypothetical protein
VAIVKGKAEESKVHIPEDVCDYLAKSVRSNIRKLEGCLVRICAYASLTGQQVTLPLAKNLLSNILVEGVRCTAGSKILENYTAPYDAAVVRKMKEKGIVIRNIQKTGNTGPAGHGPLCDATRACWITYNGEVYNHVELRRELEAAGERFQSAADTEVVVAAYRRFGPACLERLNGMATLEILPAALAESSGGKADSSPSAGDSASSSSQSPVSSRLRCRRRKPSSSTPLRRRCASPSSPRGSRASSARGWASATCGWRT